MHNECASHSKFVINKMISKAKIKYIHSLENKKNRKAEQAFVAEGPKVVGDLMAILSPRIIIATSQWLSSNNAPANAEVIEVSEEELRKVSFLQHPQQVLAVFPIPVPSPASNSAQTSLLLALDGVQDPGNLGTIIRIADWFGITEIICSNDTADVWNPKVVQATMGSIARVNVTYTDLPLYLDSLPADTPVYGTMLDGDDICNSPLEKHGIIVMGNEGKGISPDIASRLTHRLLIPNYPKDRPTADSLNVAIATAITCFEFRRS